MIKNTNIYLASFVNIWEKFFRIHKRKILTCPDSNLSSDSSRLCTKNRLPESPSVPIRFMYTLATVPDPNPSPVTVLTTYSRTETQTQTYINATLRTCKYMYKFYTLFNVLIIKQVQVFLFLLLIIQENNLQLYKLNRNTFSCIWNFVHFFPVTVRAKTLSKYLHNIYMCTVKSLKFAET